MENWVKLAFRFYADPKVAALPNEATELMFVRGLARAGEEQKAGFIPESALPELARRRRYAACASALVAAGLWSRVDGGYQVTRWADWQDGLDALSRRRAADRERQRRRRSADTSTDLSRDNGHLSRDGPPVSRDMSRDVTLTEEEKDKELPPSSPPRGRRRRTDYDSDPGFLAFWAAYPRKVNKPAGFRAWLAALNRGAKPDLVIAALTRYAAARQGQDHRFTAHPASWLNGERYNDQEPTTPETTNGWWDN